MPNEKKENKALIYKDHPKPVSRRQFLSQGLIDYSTVLMMPSLMSLMLRPEQALGAGCESSTGGGFMPFLIFDCAGGAGLSGNWLVGKQGGPTDYLSSYDRMGIPNTPQSGEPLDSRFGTPMFSVLSQVFQGILASTSASTQANLRMGTICAASQDDSSNNELSPLILISRAGLAGSKIASGVGTQNSFSGGRSKGPLIDPAIKPLRINSVDNFLDVLNYGPALDGLSEGKKSIIGRTLRNLSDGQAKRLASMSFAEELKQLADCGYKKVMGAANGGGSIGEVDPRLNSDCQQIFGITAASNGGITRIPTIMYNVIKGNTGPGAIVIGGCDYHDGTQTTGDAKDVEIGTDIGQACELAQRLGKKLFFAIISDGSVYSDQGTRVWRGDSGSKGLAVVGYLDPSGPPAMRRQQVGYFKDGQGVERGTYVGNSPDKVAYSILANYLSACGQMSKFTEVVSESEFSAAELNNHLIFG